MNTITSLEHFKRLRKDAHARGLKKYNFLMSDAELAGHIATRAVMYRDQPGCLLMVIRLHDADWAYFWLKEPEAAFLPDRAGQVIIACYGRDGSPSVFEDISTNLGLARQTKAGKYAADVAGMTFPAFPAMLRREIAIVERRDIPYEKYLEYVAPYFDMKYDSIPPDYIYAETGRHLAVLEAGYDGDTIGFLICEPKGRTVLSSLGAVSPKYRGIGLLPLLLERVALGFEKITAWIHDANEESVRIHLPLGFTPTGDYHVFYAG